MFIELTLKSTGSQTLVNLANVTNVIQSPDKQVTICLTDREDYFLVSESYEEVKDKVLKAK